MWPGGTPTLGHTKKGVIMITARQREIIQSGSPNFRYVSGVIAAGASVTVSLENQFPACRQWLPLDSFEFINNSGDNVILHIDADNAFTVMAYSIKPKADIPIRQFIIENPAGGVGVAAGEIVVNFRRLPPAVQTVRIGG